MNKWLIYGVLVCNRLETAAAVQALLTEYGCNIKTRLGLHPVAEGSCADKGLILLEMYGDEARCRELGERLAALPGVEVKSLEFCC